MNIILSEEDRKQINNWVNEFYEQKAEIKYTYSGSQRFFEHSDLVKDDDNNSFIFESEEQDDDNSQMLLI